MLLPLLGCADQVGLNYSDGGMIQSTNNIGDEAKGDTEIVSYPKVRGPEDAQHDISAGVLRLQVYGLWHPDDAWAIFLRLLHERLGIEMTPVAGCTITPVLKEKADGYNAVMERQICERFGRELLEKLAEEAVARYMDSWDRERHTIAIAQMRKVYGRDDPELFAEVARQKLQKAVEEWCSKDLGQ